MKKKLKILKTALHFIGLGCLFSSTVMLSYSFYLLASGLVSEVPIYEPNQIIVYVEFTLILYTVAYAVWLIADRAKRVIKAFS